jgi:short-subunit dehydrogenase
VVALPDSDLDHLAGLDVLIIPGDVTDQRVRRTALARTLREYSRIDVLVNSAGVGLYACPTETSISDFSRLLAVNVLAPLALAQMVIPIMRKQGGGAIVNVGSVAGRVALPWAAAYSASKFALDSIHDSLRREFQRDPIRFVKVCPGIVDTAFRNNVLAGCAPPAVSRIQKVVSADAVAIGIIRALERGRRTVYVPRIGAAFALMDALAPWLMDLYLSRFLATAIPASIPSKDNAALQPELERSQFRA